jgi:hypothetical protein
MIPPTNDRDGDTCLTALKEANETTLLDLLRLVAGNTVGDFVKAFMEENPPELM